MNCYISHLAMVSESCLEITGAASAGLPGRTREEQIGGIWNSTAEITSPEIYKNYIDKTRQHVVITIENLNMLNLWIPHLENPHLES